MLDRKLLFDDVCANLAVSIKLGVRQRRSMLTQSIVDGVLYKNTLCDSKYLRNGPSISLFPRYLIVLGGVPYRCSYNRKVI